MVGGGDKSQGLFNIQSACVNCRANILIMGRWAAAAVYLRSHSFFIGIFLSFFYVSQATGGEAAGSANVKRSHVPPVPASAPRVILASIMAGGATPAAAAASASEVRSLSD